MSDDTIFNLNYLYKLHKKALGHLYSFAGKLRTVNMSKGDFSFSPATFLSDTMSEFEKEFLHPLKTLSANETLTHLAQMHAELLFIHPFREGNGRTIRLFTNMIYIAKTGEELNFKVLNEKLDTYIEAVQQAGQKKYVLMEKLFLQTTS